MFEALQNGYSSTEETYFNNSWGNVTWNAQDQNICTANSFPYFEQSGYQSVQQVDEQKWSPDVDTSFQTIYTPLNSPPSLPSYLPLQDGNFPVSSQLSLADCSNLSEPAASSYYSFDDSLVPLSDCKQPVTSTVTSETASNRYYNCGPATAQRGRPENQMVLKSVQNTSAVQNVKHLCTKETRSPNLIIAKKQTVKTGIFRIDNRGKILGNSHCVPLNNATNIPNSKAVNKCRKFSLFTNKAKVGRPAIKSHVVQTAVQKSSQESCQWAVVRHHEICVDGQDKKFPITIIAKKSSGEESRHKPSQHLLNVETHFNLECKAKVVSKVLKHTCSICSELFATRNSLSTHMKSHQLPVCMCCLKVWRSPEHLRAHVKKRNRPGNPRIVLVTSKYGRRRNVLSTADL